MSRLVFIKLHLITDGNLPGSLATVLAIPSSLNKGTNLVFGLAPRPQSDGGGVNKWSSSVVIPCHC